MCYGLKTRQKQHFITITFPVAHHYCIVDTAVHGQGIFKTMIHFPNHELAQRVPQHGDALMTIAQQLEQKGIEKGIQLGEQRGIEKGEREATLKIARTMLQNGIDRNTVMKMTGLTEDDLAQIRH